MVSPHSYQPGQFGHFLDIDTKEYIQGEVRQVLQIDGEITLKIISRTDCGVCIRPVTVRRESI